MFTLRNAIVASALFLMSAAAASAFPASATTDLNVRSGPGTKYRVVGALRPGETVDVTGSSGGWYRLAGGGWASARYLVRGGYAAEPFYRDYDVYPDVYFGIGGPYWSDFGYFWPRHRYHRHRWSGHRWPGHRWRGHRGHGPRVGHHRGFRQKWHPRRGRH